MAEIDYRLGDYQQSKNFAEVLAGGAGGSVSDALVCKYTYSSGSKVYFSGFAASGPQSSWNGTGGDANIPWQITRDSAGALTVGPGNDPQNDLGPQGLTLNQAGVYLHTLSINLRTDDRYTQGQIGAVTKGNFTLRVTDYSFLDNALQWAYDTSLTNSLSITYVGVYNAGDTAALPFINNYVGPYPMMVNFANYTAVKLAS